MLKVVVDYPKKEEERLIVRMNNFGEFPKVSPVVSTEDIVRARQIVREVYMDEKIEKYIVDLFYATRNPEECNLTSLKRRGYVIPEDVRAVCHEVLRHRIGLTYEAEAENVTTDEIIEQVINAVIVP